jgi:hypothetical protein
LRAQLERRANSERRPLGFELQALSMGEEEYKGKKRVEVGSRKCAREPKRRNITDNDCMRATCERGMPPLVMARWIGIFCIKDPDFTILLFELFCNSKYEIMP